MPIRSTQFISITIRHARCGHSGREIDPRIRRNAKISSKAKAWKEGGERGEERRERETLLFDPGPIVRVSEPPRSVGVTQVATPIHLMGTNIIIAASSLLSIQINWCFLARSLLQPHTTHPSYLSRYKVFKTAFLF